MVNLTLYHFPTACSQVALFALESTGFEFDLRLIDLTAGEQNSPEYLAISPTGKVPLLVADNVAISENAAIHVYLAALAPQANLLPCGATALARAEQQSGLSFCSGTLHPIVRSLVNPSRVTDGDVAPVHRRALKLAAQSFGYADRKISERGAWLGAPSIFDAYLDWATRTAVKGGFDLSPFKALAALNSLLRENPIYAHIIEQDRKRLGELNSRRSII